MNTQGLDAWHKIIFTAIATVFTSLTAAVAAMWRRDLRRERARQLEHDEHVQDVKTLTNQLIELARAATYAPPLKPSERPPNDSEE